MKRWIRRIVFVALVAAATLFYFNGRRYWHPMWVRLHGQRSVDDVLAAAGPAAAERLRPHLERAGVAWPPPQAALLAFKEEKRLELWGWTAARWALVRSYPILAASGRAGPKLREGDRQVPEGVYRITDLNPNSSYHLSMQLNYPSAMDRRRAAEDGRSGLGGEIFIHGRNLSIGCLAMGDEAIEELFVLVHETGIENVVVILAPNDLRGGRPAVRSPDAPPWVDALYDTLRRELAAFDAAPAEVPRER